MPRNATITLNDVPAICERIQKQGVRPTVTMIMDEHGSGSRGTVHRLFKRWKESQQQSIVPSAVLPPEIQKAILALMGQEVSAATLPLQQELAESEQAAEDLARENVRHANTIEATLEEVATLRESLANGEGHITSLEAELAEARATATRERQAAESARTDLAKAQLRLEGLPAIQQDLVEARALIGSERQRRIAAEQNHVIAVAQRDSLESRLVESKELLNEAKAHAERTMKSLHLERDEVRRLVQSVADLRVVAESAHRNALEAKVESECVTSELNLRKKAAAEQPPATEMAAAGEKPAATGQGKEKPTPTDKT